MDEPIPISKLIEGLDLIPEKPKPKGKDSFPKFNWGFNTFGDPALEKMLKGCKDYCQRVLNGERLFITLSGPPEIGKTHLLNKMDDFFYDHKVGLDTDYYKRGRVHKNFKNHYDNLYFITTQVLKDPDYLNQVMWSGTLAIEELFSWRSGRDNKFTDIQIDIAFQILNHRINTHDKPMITMIDTNKTLAELEKIDDRIASRLLRQGGIFIELPEDTEGFLTRNV